MCSLFTSITEPPLPHLLPPLPEPPPAKVDLPGEHIDLTTGSASDASGDSYTNKNTASVREQDAAATPVKSNPWVMARMKGLGREKSDQITRAVVKYIVKDLRPFSTIESQPFRDMLKAMNEKYRPPCRKTLADDLIPAWYEAVKQDLMTQLDRASFVAVTADHWTSIASDHYLTITVHYIDLNFTWAEKVLQTRAVYTAQTGEKIAERILECLFEYDYEKVVAATVDNARNMDVGINKLAKLKIGCFCHVMNLAAQEVYKINPVMRWVAKVRTIVVYFKRCAMAKVLLTRKQALLGLRKNQLILDVRTRWNTLYLMIARFAEQYPAVAAAVRDPELKKTSEKDK